MDPVTESAIAIRMTCFDPAGAPVVARFDGSARATALAESADALGRAAAGAGAGPAVRLPRERGADALAAALAARIRETGATPSVVGVEGMGVFALADRGPGACRLLRALLGRPAGAAPAGVARPGSRLQGHVAVVTGGAQGFGRGIAEDLAREGACVVVADVKDEAGVAFAAELDGQWGEGTALFCHMDVTKGASVEAGLDAAARAFGGVDLFVSNAGVLKAGSLEEMDEAAFDLVTAVNYKAFFVCVKAAAAAMKLQHRINPRHFTDIVQVNSKSGLEGSNRNFAYAGSKFGGIGLTQSFALELMPHRIKVNAVCPGNYFEGPLWSDPRSGLFVQYLKAGKVPGAQTVDDVKAFYMSKVPMGRGCLPADVVKAILYLHDQEYETGQAVPVTGGQVMLR